MCPNLSRSRRSFVRLFFGALLVAVAPVLAPAQVPAAAPAAAAVESKFSETQREYVHSYIRQSIPDFPREFAEPAVELFLGELQRKFPGETERMLSPDFSFKKYDTILFRLLGAQLTGSTQTALREDVARRRVQAVLEQEAAGKLVGAMEARIAITKIKTMASFYPRRLFEGRMDDDELALLLKKTREADAPAPAPAAPAKPRELTASDIVSEFGRRNQEGAAWQKLRALAIESTLKTATGEDLKVFLFRLRPDRFRMVIQAGGATRFVTMFDGAKYWQQVPGRPWQEIPERSVGPSRYLGEFVDPLVAESGVTYSRLPDSTEGEQKIYRIGVRRADGSGYTAWIDQTTFRQVGRETDDKQTVRYSDFRSVAGIMMAFREDSTDANGKKTVLTLTRASADPGLIQSFFEPAESGSLGFFELERMLGRAAAPVAATKGTP
jgi:hypothetical protein